MIKSKLKDFLDGTGKEGDSDKKRDGRKSEGERTTHNGMSGGAWTIDDDDIPEFYRHYSDYIRNHGFLHLTEKSTRIGALRVDLDFIYAGELENHLHNQQQVVNFTNAYMHEVKKLLVVPENIEIFVSEKQHPTFYKEKNKSKSGLHIVVPTLKSNRYVEEEIRRNLLNRMPEFFPGLPLADDWKKVYDPSPLTHTNNWTMLGSKKKEGTPYQIKYILDWNSVSGEMSIDDDVPVLATPELLKKMSVRSPSSDETDMTEHAKSILKRARDGDAAPISGGHAVQPGRGRQMERGQPSSRASSPDHTTYQPLHPSMMKYYEKHVGNLAEFRFKERAHWIEVGQCLKNIHVDLFTVWDDFSQGDPSQYNPRECMTRWNSFGFRTEGMKLGIKSLRYWSRTDNPDGYDEIEKMYTEGLIEEAVGTGAEHDMAQVVFSMFRDKFKCAKFGNNVWYRFIGHVWRETDKGIGLQIMLSTEVFREIRNVKLKKELAARDAECVCPTGKGAEKDQDCPSCKAEKEDARFREMMLKLKQTKFKDNVMKECREVFLDEEFAEKLDENKNLIAFSNGVFDTLKMEFRDGSPDDYISFSTNIEFDQQTPYYRNECWPELEKFIADVLPDPEIRVYFLQHLSTSLSGGNDAQKFHILTGSGSNGKSMLMNLMSTCMGDYSCKAPISLLTQQRNKSAAAAPELVRMKGRRFVTMQEPDEGVPLNTGLMKELASCEKITARDLYAGSKAMIDFDIQARFHLACNEKPKINATDGGTWRRLIVINFRSKFVAQPHGPDEKPIDESIIQKTVSKEWTTTFMSYLIHLYKEGNGFRKLVPPEKAMEHTNEYKEENDVIARFIREYIHAYPNPQPENPDPVTMSSLKTEFKAWKVANEISFGTTPAQLVKRIEAMYGKFVKNGWTSFRCGLA